MEESRPCPFCGSQDVENKSGQTYHFVEVGLDNVYLANIDTSHCRECGADAVSIPQSEQLLHCIGEALVLSSGLLTGPEIRFLRKNLRVKINDFAKLLRVNRVTVSRWENGQDITEPIDLLIRSIYLLEGPGINEQIRSEFKKFLSEQQRKPKKRKRIEIPLPLQPLSCKPAMACA